MQEELVTIWKENLLENLEIEETEFGLVGEFLLELRKELEEGDKESVKVTELKRIEQREKTIEEFVQEFQRVARGSRYKERALVEEFKKVIRRKLMEAERPLTSIEQLYKHATKLDRH